MPRKQTRAAPPAASGTAPTSAPLSIVILAAGQGKRMQSDIPKVLQPLAGMPMLAHVLGLAARLTPASIHVVYGHGGERVRELFDDGRLRWSLQSRQLGTGDALQQAMPDIPDSHQVLVLLTETLRGLIERSGARSVALLTAQLTDPSGYGRLLRGPRGDLRRIVEERDANAKQRAIREVNTGVLVASARFLKDWLARLKPRNAQREYYLTDIVGLAVK